MTTQTRSGTCHLAGPRRRYPHLPGACRPPTPPQNKEMMNVSEGDLYYSPERPWLPPAEPVPFPEGRLTPEWVGEVARRRGGNAPFDLVLRSHLRAENTNDPRYMAAWRTFWRALAFAGRQNILKLLHEWRAAAAEAKQRPDLSDEEQTWIARFIPNVDAALDRLNRAKNEPMAWAGPNYAKYPPEQRARTEALIGAIVLHRDGDINDQELYNILGCLDIDPKGSAQSIDEDNLDRIMDACIEGHPLDLESTYHIKGERRRRQR